MQAPASGARRESDKARPWPRRAVQAERAPRRRRPLHQRHRNRKWYSRTSLPDAAIPTPAAPPPPEAAPTRAAPSPAAAAKAISDETRTQAAERNSAAATAAQSREDAFAEDVPPATADSPEVREAWLQRIRELAEAGNADDARASLEEFVRRYPNHPLPDDLRALLE